VNARNPTSIATMLLPLGALAIPTSVAMVEGDGLGTQLLGSNPDFMATHSFTYSHESLPHNSGS
jgi:hypothetical protein